jgi:hypothetical protein
VASDHSHAPERIQERMKTAFLWLIVVAIIASLVLSSTCFF